MKIRWRALVTALIIPLLAGGLGALLAGGMDEYELLALPPLSPPGWLFPAAWTLLYLMMGAASYRVYVLRWPEDLRRTALRLYAAQLAVNVLWLPLFFRFALFWAAAVWLAVLIVLAAMTRAKFRRMDDLAGALLVPYLLWCVFALYLNIGVAVLN